MQEVVGPKGRGRVRVAALCLLPFIPRAGVVTARIEREAQMESDQRRARMPFDEGPQPRQRPARPSRHRRPDRSLEGAWILRVERIELAARRAAVAAIVRALRGP